jgi:hypothetical protein
MLLTRFRLVTFQVCKMPTKNRRRWRLPLFACIPLTAVSLLALVTPTGAAPVPFKNCGKAGDILTIQTMDASVWPPQTAAPLVATATIDPATHQLTNLRVFRFFGVEWTFDSGSLPTSLSLGFVPLPGSLPVSVTSPPLPLGGAVQHYAHVRVRRRAP